MIKYNQFKSFKIIQVILVAIGLPLIATLIHPLVFLFTGQDSVIGWNIIANGLSFIWGNIFILLVSIGLIGINLSSGKIKLAYFGAILFGLLFASLILIPRLCEL